MLTCSMLSGILQGQTPCHADMLHALLVWLALLAWFELILCCAAMHPGVMRLRACERGIPFDKIAYLMLQAAGDADGEAPSKGLFALPFMRRAQERRAANAKADAAALLREMEVADAQVCRALVTAQPCLTPGD